MLNRVILIMLLVGLGVVAFEPFGIVMPTSAQMIGASVLLGILVFVIGLLWQEKPRDEREEEILNRRGKYANYAGLIVGSVGLTISAFDHHVNWWLVAVVGSMITIKLLRRM